MIALLVLLTSGCGLQKETVNEDLVTEDGTSVDSEISLVVPSCLNAWEGALTENDVLDVFANSTDYYLDPVSKLFQNPKFNELNNVSSPKQLCILGDNVAFAFYKDSNYSDVGEFNNAIGLYTSDGLVLDYKYNKGSGDIGVCNIIGYLDGVLYQCGGGDGPFSWRKVYLLMPNGQSKTIQDCEFTGEYSDGEKEYKPTATCTVDLLGTAAL